MFAARADAIPVGESSIATTPPRVIRCAEKRAGSKIGFRMRLEVVDVVGRHDPTEAAE